MFYSLGEKIVIALALVYTKIFWKEARLVRLPIRARNKKNISYKVGFTTGYACRITAGVNKKIEVGKNFTCGDYCQFEGSGGIIIGDNVLVGSRVLISTTTHGVYSGENQSNPVVAPLMREISYREVYIGNNVWIGNNVSILNGVKVGDGCIVGANSVVTKNVPSNTIVAGNPAKVVKKWNEELKTWEKI